MWNPETRESFSDNGRLQHQLTVQSQQIEEVLRRHDLPADVAGGSVDNGSIRFQLKTQLASGWERLLMLKDDLMHALGSQDVSFSQHDDGQWQLAVSHEAEKNLSLLPLLRRLPTVPKATAVLGLAEDGQPVTLDFTQPDMTHTLVSGLSGAGKTALLRTIAVSLALHNRQSQVQLIVADLNSAYDGSQRVSLAPLSYLPHMLSEVVYDLDDMGYVFKFLLEECQHRQQNQIKWPTIVILIDDILPILQSGQSKMVAALTKLLQEGASAGIHLIATTSNPETAVLTTLLKANLPVRLVGQMRDEYQARAASGLMGTQAHHLRGAGDFLAVTPKGVVHFQGGYVGDYDLHLAIDRLYQSRPKALLAQSVVQQPQEPRQFLFNGQIVSLEGAVDEVGARIIQEPVQPSPTPNGVNPHEDIIPDVVAKMLARHQLPMPEPLAEPKPPLIEDIPVPSEMGSPLFAFREEVGFSIFEPEEPVSPALVFESVAEEERPFTDWHIEQVSFKPLAKPEPEETVSLVDDLADFPFFTNDMISETLGLPFLEDETPLPEKDSLAEPIKSLPIQPKPEKPQPRRIVKPIELDLDAVSAKLAQTLSFTETTLPLPEKKEPKPKEEPVAKRPFVARKAPTPTPMNFDALLKTDLLKKGSEIAPPKRDPLDELAEPDEPILDEISYVDDEDVHIEYDDEFIPFE